MSAGVHERKVASGATFHLRTADHGVPCAALAVCPCLECFVQMAPHFDLVERKGFGEM